MAKMRNSTISWSHVRGQFVSRSRHFDPELVEWLEAQ
jgi:hypothetical protein